MTQQSLPTSEGLTKATYSTLLSYKAGKRIVKYSLEAIDHVVDERVHQWNNRPKEAAVGGTFTCPLQREHDGADGTRRISRDRGLPLVLTGQPAQPDQEMRRNQRANAIALLKALGLVWSIEDVDKTTNEKAAISNIADKMKAG